MRVFIYNGGLRLVGKSGVGQAILHQREMLRRARIDTADHWCQRAGAVHINTVLPDKVLAALAAKLMGRKVIYYGHSTMEDFRRSFRGSDRLAPLFRKWITFCYSLGDVVLTPTEYSRRLLESYGLKKDFPLGGKRVIGTPAHYAYLKIAEGCNNRCHYCAIPGIRGPLHSRDMADCVAEARWLAGEGVKELIVVAQDPTAYGEDWGKPGSICELLDKLNKVPGLEWIRIMYAYPERITDEFIAAMKRNEKVVPYLDLPIQHCNDTILKNMNRRSTRAELLEVIGKLRREIPGITLRTTLIAGFPGETEEQFEDLCNFVKEVQFDRLGCFAYSAEENTVAARMDGQIEQEVKDKRAELVMQIQTGIMAQKQAEKVGQTVHVLCDGIDEENGLYLCRTTGDAPEVDGCVCVSSEEPLYPGQFYDVLVEDSDLYDLYGTVVK